MSIQSYLTGYPENESFNAHLVEGGFGNYNALCKTEKHITVFPDDITISAHQLDPNHYYGACLGIAK